MGNSKEAKKRQQLNRRNRVFAFVMGIKETSQCVCGESRPECLDFHHLENKSFDIMHAVRRGIGIESLKKELEKCEIKCANCHRYEHRKAV